MKKFIYLLGMTAFSISAIAETVAIVMNDDLIKYDPVKDGVIPPVVGTGPIYESSKIFASDGANSDEYGLSSAISGDYAVVGSHQDKSTITGLNTGSAYVYHFDGSNWVEMQKLTASDTVHDASYFGQNVAIDNGKIIIGAHASTGLDQYGKNVTATGKAYVYKLNGSTWQEEAILEASDKSSLDYFGSSVDIEGSNIIVGAFGKDDNGSTSGGAYVFKFNGTSWVEEQLLLATDSSGMDGDRLGVSVGISGNIAIVGAPREDENGSNAGAVYIFEDNGTSWVGQKIVSIDGLSGDNFGISSAINGTRAVVGSIYQDDFGASSGAAYILEKNGSSWDQTKILADDAAAGAQFGKSVAIDGTNIVVGALKDSEVNSSSGAGYYFRKDGSSWVQRKLLTTNGQANDSIGVSVGISGNKAIVGSSGDDTNGSASGSAYIHDF